MPNVSLTGIEFTIKGSADKASASVDSLIQKLSNLNAALSNGANAQAFAKGLEGIAKAASSLNGMDISGAQSALSQLAQSMESFKELGATAKNVAAFGNSMSKLAAKPENLMQVAEILAKIATIDFTNIKEAGEGLRNIAAAANSLAKIPQATKETGDAAKKANSPLKTFLKSLGRIAFYRIIRGVLKSITQAFQEGLKNAYMFDKVAGGGLAEALDNLATKSLTMKNQLGAAFGGLLTAITPVVIQIIKIVTALASAITRLIAILGGNSQWLKAKDVWTEWEDAAEGAGGAAKEALKYLAPFDELNVLPSQRSGGGGGGGDNYGDMFEWVDTDVGSGFLDSITEAFKKLSDWFESKDWQDIGGKAWQTLKDIFTDGTAANEAVTSFMEALGSAFGAIVGTAWGFIHDLVEDLAIQFKNNLIDYNGDGKLTATDFLKAVLKTGGDIATWIYDTLVKPFFDGFGRALTGDSTFDFTNWAKENFLNPIIRAWNGFTQSMINPMIEKINEVIDYINDKFSTDIPHIPLLGEVAELEIKVPKKDRKIPNGMMTVKEFQDAVPAKNKTIGGMTAKATNVKDGISKDKKWFENFGVSVSTLNDKIAAKAKQISGVKANIDAVKTSPVKKGGLTLGGISAAIVKVDTAKLTAEQKRVTTTANMKYVRTGDLTSDQRRLWTTANMKYVRTNDLTDEKRRIGTTANLKSALNNIPKTQLSLESTAEVKAKVIKSTLQDPYTHNLQLDATAHITSITGQTTVPILYGNGIAGGMSASGGGVRYSLESGDNEEVLYRAMSRALADSELGGDIELDGEVLYKRMVNRNRANTRLTGVNALA